MSSPSRNSSESDMTILKNLAEKVAQDVQALSFRQLHHETQFVQIQDDLKMVKDEYNKSKKISHPSSSRGNESYGEQSLRINEYYQHPLVKLERKEKKTQRRLG